MNKLFLTFVGLLALWGGGAAAALPWLSLDEGRNEIALEDSSGSVPRAGAPVRYRAGLDEKTLALAMEGRLQLQEPGDVPGGAVPVAVQFEPMEAGGSQGHLCWVMPPGKAAGPRYVLRAGLKPWPTIMTVREQSRDGQLEVMESGRRVLRYVYRTVEPGDLLEAVHPDNRKYARARSDYIHPLYGLDGEELTRDWPMDHPHHRGIYWAWPETKYRGQNGDLHALQRVMARPTGRYRVTLGPVYAQIAAENQWVWEDQTPIVLETAIIRAYKQGVNGRCLDLKFIFTALKEGVTIARRETDKYGGLNIRLAATTRQEIVFHTDPAKAKPRMAWADFLGVFGSGDGQIGLAVLQRRSNPDYPGDWIQYPEIQWFQPTFPASGRRYAMKPGQRLVLQYRLWIHAGGREADEVYMDQWRVYQDWGGL